MVWSHSARISTNTDIPRWSDTILKTPGRHGSEAIEKRGLKQAWVSHHWFPGTLQAGTGHNTQNTRTHKPYIQQDGTAAYRSLDTGFQEHNRREQDTTLKTPGPTSLTYNRTGLQQTGLSTLVSRNTTGKNRTQHSKHQDPQALHTTGRDCSRQVFRHWFPGTQQARTGHNTQNTRTRKPYKCNGGPFWQAISSYVRFFFPSQFSPKKCDILQVYFWPDFWSLTVCSESHKSAIVACVLVRWHSWTWFVYVVGPIWLVSWPAWRASSGAVSPQTQAHRACQLNRKHSRFRGRTCGHNAGFLMCFGQQ